MRYTRLSTGGVLFEELPTIDQAEAVLLRCAVLRAAQALNTQQSCARELGVSIGVLRYRLKKFGLRWPANGADDACEADHWLRTSEQPHPSRG